MLQVQRRTACTRRTITQMGCMQGKVPQQQATMKLSVLIVSRVLHVDLLQRHASAIAHAKALGTQVG